MNKRLHLSVESIPVLLFLVLAFMFVSANPHNRGTLLSTGFLFEKSQPQTLTVAAVIRRPVELVAYGYDKTTGRVTFKERPRYYQEKKRLTVRLTANVADSLSFQQK